jgi:hypothetical protein
MFNNANNIKYKSFDSLEEAKNYENTYVIFEGDYGGQIYLTCSTKIVKCTEEELYTLLKEIDEKNWQEPEGAGIYFEQIPEKRGVVGGMNGGYITDDLWVHPQIENINEEEIRKVITKK